MDSTFLSISAFFFYMQMIINIYFLESYLTPKYGKKSFIWGCLLSIVFLFIIFNYIYTIVPLRMIFGVIYFELLAWLFYDGKVFKKFAAGPIMFICAAIAEVIIQFILVFVLKTPIVTLLSPMVLFIILLLNTILFLIIVKLFLHFFSRPFTTTPQYSKLFFASITTIFLITVILSESLYMNQFFFVVPATESYTFSYIVSFMCFIMCILLNIYIYYSIKSLKNDLSKQLISQLIHDEYLKEMNDLIQTKNTQEELAYLRHDIMNYIQTTTQYMKEERLYDSKNKNSLF